MKHLKLFFALFAMLALGVGNAWGAEVTMAAGTNGSACTVNNINGIKVGTSKAGGDMTITVPAGATSLQLYAAAWKGVTGLSINITPESNVNPTSISLTADDGITSNSPFTLNGDAESFKHEVTLSNITSETTLTLKSSNAKRFVVWGATCTVAGGETPGEGGGDPEEPTPGTGGDALSYTWDLSTNSYSAASNTQVTWSATDVNMVADKGTAGTAPNNYLGGDANNRTSSRFYGNSILTITPEANVTITSVVFAATSDGYASALKSSTWTNAEATVSSKTVTVTPTNGASAISAIIGGTCGFTGVTVNYIKAASDDPEPVIVKTLKSIEVTGMTTTFEQGDVFKFDGTCTATYSVTKDGAAQDDETAEVTPTNVSTPDMNQIGTQTIYVTYSEGGVEKTDDYEITITENTVTAGEYCITPDNDFWGTTFNGSLSGDALNQVYTGRQDDITVQYSKGSGSNLYINNTQTRTYSGTTLTFSVPSGYVITAIVFTADGTNWKGTHTANVGSMTDSKTWAGSANEVTITFGGTCRITKICVTYEAIDLTLPSAPTFNPEAGTYNAVQNVTISAEAGTTIYYTLDGIDPTIASNVYSSAIEISETTTVKAIAVKGEKVSPVASATYTINLPLTTMDQIFAKASEVKSTATPVEITFGNWVVSAVKEDGKTAFVTDGIKGFVIYEAGCGFNVGDVLSGTAACKVLLYNGFAELTGLTSSTTGLSVTTGGTITTQELDATAIEALTGVNTGSLIKINGICSSSDSKYYVAGVQIYTALYDFGTLNVGAEYNITGIYQPYNSTKEMLPRSAEDIEEVVGLPTATIEVSNITMEVGQEKAIEATITPDAAQSTVQYAITAGNEYITLNGTTITAVAAGTATITATVAEVAGEYKGATKTFTVTVKPQNIAILPFTFTGGKTDIENTLGMSQTGLGNDYSGTTNLRFDNTDDCVVIHFDSEPGQLSYEIKGNSFSGGTFSVQQSADGSAYTEVVTHTELGEAATKEHVLAAESRYVKFIYTEKSSGNVGLGNISITKADHRQDAGLVWNPATVSLTVGDAFTAPTFSNPNNLTGITFASDNEALATVTNAGVISLVSGKTGIATITATYAGDATYKAAEVTCTITVDHKSEDIVILAKCKDQYYALVAENLKSNVLKALPVEYVGGKIYNVETEDQASIIWKRSVVDGKTTFKNGENYLSAVNSADLNLATEACEWVFDGNMYKIEGSTRTILYYTSTGGFKNYSTQNISKDGVNGEYSSAAITVAPVFADGDAYHRTVTSGNYGTMCIPYGTSNYSGAKFYEVSWFETGNALWLDEVNGALVAGKPYIFLATASEIAIIGNGTTAAAPVAGVNGLTGTFTDIAAGGVTDNYIIAQNCIWVANDNNYVNAYRAYIKASDLPTTEQAQLPGRRRVCMGENVETGLDQIVAPEGQAVKAIVNGQLIIIRDGVKYNVQGQKL